MKYLLLIAALFVAQVQANQEPNINVSFVKLQNDVQEYVHESTGEWVKYSGTFGFGYPYKTGTQAIEYNGVVYYTYSKCLKFYGYMIVFVADSLGNKTVIRRIPSAFCDPHENASLHIDNNGFITAAQASRGKWRKGYVYKFTNPEDISEFEQVDSGYYSYTKLHDNGMIYTDYNGSLYNSKYKAIQAQAEYNKGQSLKKYKPEGDLPSRLKLSKSIGNLTTKMSDSGEMLTSNGLTVRETWIKTDAGKQKLVNGGSYAITTEVNGQIHMLYNYHFAGNLDLRVNLYYMWSPDGISWFNRHGESLVLPVAENSQKTAISIDYHKFNYLKDLKFIDGEIQALVVQSDSNDPMEGSRQLVKFTMDGESEVITNMGHSYDGAQFWNDTIIAVKNNKHSYAGGALFQYSLGGEFIGTYRNDGGANYPVAVKNSNKLMFADSGGLFISE